AQLGGFATDWAGSSMPFATAQAQYDTLRERLYGTAEVPWPAADEEAPATDADPRVAADALIARLASEQRPLRVLIGDDAPGLAAMAYAARRDSYGAQPPFDWPA